MKIESVFLQCVFFVFYKVPDILLVVFLSVSLYPYLEILCSYHGSKGQFALVLADDK